MALPRKWSACETIYFFLMLFFLLYTKLKYAAIGMYIAMPLSLFSKKILWGSAKHSPKRELFFNAECEARSFEKKSPVQGNIWFAGYHFQV